MHKYFIEIKKLFRIAIPILFTQIVYILIGLVNIVMSGHFSKIDAVVISMGTSIWLPIILFSHGILLPLIPLISEFNVINNKKNINEYIKQAYVLTIIMSSITMFVLHEITYLIPLFINKNLYLVTKLKLYLNIILYSIPGYLFLQILRCVCESLLLISLEMMISFLGILLYVPINYIFTYGYNLVPQFGSIGCAISTVLIYWIMFFLTGILLSKSTYSKKIKVFNIFNKPNIKILTKLFKLGIPIGLTIFFEITLFTIVALLISNMSIEEAISHQISISFSSLIFVIPFSLSIATTIRIGYYLGLGLKNKAKFVSWIAQLIGIIISFFICFISIIFRKQIAAIYNLNLDIINISSYLILLVSIYQVSDSIQIIGCGILKGYQDTKSIFFITFFSYWILGLPIGYILSITDWISSPMGPAGFWIGFIIGFTIAAILTVMRIIHIQKKDMLL
ncbi:MATE family efflux transporter [Enterobacteriaceae endosymbiont of Donacia tomentosa]|uniref:MATE family efflux transporter n=1 Tax=Enterobacteriaceae endosymbiont of Donacia tomentosa TaxID=2675787 RepID=UPI0014576450|nr:MATE family efflux transporter [Enterobacteriaceae endosymbiont of Donacia tomentosa]